MIKLTRLTLKIALCAVVSFSANKILSMEKSEDGVFGDLVNHETIEEIDWDLAEKYLEALIDKNITPENTVFAFDVHEVLFDRYLPTIVWGALKLFCKSFVYLLMHPSFIMRLREIYREHAIFEGMYVQMVEEYPYWEQFKPDFLEISNCSCYPIDPMIKLLEILKHKGFKIFMLSNMGAVTWEDFGTKFKPVVELFDGFYTPNKDNEYIGKPSIEFYEGFKNYLHSIGCENRQILFIDDIEKNIMGANDTAIAGIHFTGHEKLCKVLSHLGLELDE